MQRRVLVHLNNLSAVAVFFFLFVLHLAVLLFDKCREEQKHRTQGLMGLLGGVRRSNVGVSACFPPAIEDFEGVALHLVLSSLNSVTSGSLMRTLPP